MITPNTEIMDFSKLQKLVDTLRSLSSKNYYEYNELQDFVNCAIKNNEFSSEWKLILKETFQELFLHPHEKDYQKTFFHISNLKEYIPSLNSYDELNSYLDVAISMIYSKSKISYSREATSGIEHYSKRTDRKKEQITFLNKEFSESALGKAFKIQLEKAIDTVKSADKIVNRIKTELMKKKGVVEDEINAFGEATAEFNENFTVLGNLMNVAMPEFESTSLTFERVNNSPAQVHYFDSSLFRMQIH